MDWWKKKEKKKQALLCKEIGAMLLEDVIKCCDGKSNPIRFFSAELILKATDNFSNDIPGVEYFHCYWFWYSGKTDNSRMILVKLYSNLLRNLDSYFCRDVVISSMVSGHKNFMKLVGCCLELEYPVMVYYGEKNQYSLIDFSKIVSWRRRMKIAEDIATALAYLHTAFSTPFVYRNISIENILIDEDGVAKLNDFFYCISIPQGEKFVTVDKIVGTYYYMDSNYRNNAIVSEKTDVYGFGMFMIMLLIGGREILADVHYLAEEPDVEYTNPDWLANFIEERGLCDEMVDPKMFENMGEVTEEERCGMNAFLFLSMRCLGLKGEVPTMVEVTKELKKIQRSSQDASSS